MPASLSRKWITDVLRREIGYRGLVLSDDLEMGGVLAAAPIERAAVEHIRAGGDICLLCHRADYIFSAHEELIREAERDRKFAARVAESSKKILNFKKKTNVLTRRTPPPARNKLERLSRRLWEFGEQVRLSAPQRESA
jgi:beta-N-acetylhexosaminidase